MKSVENIYQKIFIQVWILVLSAMVFKSGIWLLKDLKNYKYTIVEGFAPTYTQLMDKQQGKPFIRVSINCKPELMYTGPMHNLPFSGFGYPVSSESGYKATCDAIYLDIYETKNKERVFLKSICASEYQEDFYDLEYGRWIQIIPRMENVKYQYPKWRIYVPILIFVLTVPIMLLSVCLIVIKIIEKAKIKKETKAEADEGKWRAHCR